MWANNRTTKKQKIVISVTFQVFYVLFFPSISRQFGGKPVFMGGFSRMWAGFSSLTLKDLRQKRRDWHDKEGKENKRLLSTARMNNALATREWADIDPNYGKQVANTEYFAQLLKEKFPSLPWS